MSHSFRRSNRSRAVALGFLGYVNIINVRFCTHPNRIEKRDFYSAFLPLVLRVFLLDVPNSFLSGGIESEIACFATRALEIVRNVFELYVYTFVFD